MKKYSCIIAAFLTFTLSAQQVQPTQPTNLTQSIDSVRQQLQGLFEKFMRDTHDPKSPVMKRPVFGKDYGCLTAKFIPNPKLDPKYKIGPFKYPWRPAWIRFAKDGSNLDPDNKPGTPGQDAVGMSIKIVGVDGPKLLEGEEDAVTQDFITQDHENFFSKNAFTFAKLNLVGPDPSEQAILTEMDKTVLADPLDGQFWNPLATSFGSLGNMKYMVKPGVVVNGSNGVECQALDVLPDPTKKPMTSPTYRRENVIAHLQQAQKDQKDICMKFYIQFQTDPSTTDNAQAKWSQEGKGKFQEFATLMISPNQDIEDPTRRLTCENLSFNDWHTIPELTPQGSLSAIRRPIYKYFAALRRKFNKEQQPDKVTDAMLKEPTSLIIDPLIADKAAENQGHPPGNGNNEQNPTH